MTLMIMKWIMMMIMMIIKIKIMTVTIIITLEPGLRLSRSSPTAIGPGVSQQILHIIRLVSNFERRMNL